MRCPLAHFYSAVDIQGFVEVPFIVGVHYGVNASARADADAKAQLGPINLENACLIYDPVSMSYSGTADLSLFANLRGSARISASLEGFLSDFLCLLNWVTLRGTMSAGVTVQLPTDLRVGVDLYCENGVLTVLPRAGLTTCLNIFGEIRAGLDVFLLSFNVFSQEWPLIEKTIQKCWQMNLKFDPFVVGTAPKFKLDSSLLALESLLGELFDPAAKKDIDHTPARSPLPAAPSLLFPCLSDDPPDEPVEPDANCGTKARGPDAVRIVPDKAAREPRWSATRSVFIPGGGSADVATEMVAPFLESEVAKGGSPTDDATQKGIYRHRGLPTAGCFKKSSGESGRKQQRFIKGHLLNAKIGGPGTDEKNLFPLVEQANADHSADVENGGVLGGLGVVNTIQTGGLAFYKVTVQNPSSPIEIMNAAGAGTGFFEIRATFLCEVADYQLCTDDTLKKNPSTFVPIASRFVFHPSGGKPFDQISDPAKCKR
ncbi:MAG: hypothetical protein INF92_11740 [Rhodobacter sp.]|nr:hypothetical protein [Rhodobacter sp.]